MTYIKLKNNQWWVWSSKKASLDCLPQAKFDCKDLAEQYVINRINHVSQELKKKIEARKKLLSNWALGFNKQSKGKEKRDG